jgi:hypothetical protein
MSRSSLRVRDFTHDGGERLIQLRQLADMPVQLKKKIAETRDQ